MSYNTFNKDNWGLVPVSTSVPRSYLAKLKKYSSDLRLPMSQLIARAIKNELACENPFEAPVLKVPKFLPDSPESVASFESRKLYDYISKYPGLNLEQLVMSYEDIGLKDEAEVLQAYAKLLCVSIVYESHPARAKYNYPPEYKVIKSRKNQTIIKEGRRKFKPLEAEKAPLHEVDDEA